MSHILIVDDSSADRCLAKIFLRDHVHTIDEAVDGKHALEMIKGQDMVIMDYDMPIMNGIGATKQLRIAGYTKPIVVLTGDAESVRDLSPFGETAVLSKETYLTEPGMRQLVDTYIR